MMLFMDIAVSLIGNWEELDNEEQIMTEMSSSINPNRVNFFSFPDYENPRLKDDMVHYFICLVFQLPLKHRLIIIALLVVCILFHHFFLVAFLNFIISFLLRF